MVDRLRAGNKEMRHDHDMTAGIMTADETRTKSTLSLKIRRAKLAFPRPTVVHSIFPKHSRDTQAAFRNPLSSSLHKPPRYRPWACLGHVPICSCPSRSAVLAEFGENGHVSRPRCHRQRRHVCQQELGEWTKHNAASVFFLVSIHQLATSFHNHYIHINMFHQHRRCKGQPAHPCLYVINPNKKPSQARPRHLVGGP